MEIEGNRKRRPPGCWLPFWAAATIALAVAAGATAGPPAPRAAVGAKPRITADHITFGARRKSQMAAYSHRHYGDREWRLRRPKVIVLHFTATDSYPAVFGTFDSDAPNLGELPGVCAHYVIEQDGRIDELVPPRIRCRHTVGLNDVALGIEMVQASGRGSHWADRQILERHRQIRAALRLVGWLQGRYRIPASEVIGHSMANDDPHFTDREGWVNDHTDWLKRDVREFRSRLRPGHGKRIR